MRVHCGPQPESWTVGFLCLQNETQFCAYFLFDKLFRVFDGSIVMVFVVFKILVVISGLVMRALEVSSFALTTEFVVCVCVCVLFVVASATGFTA